MHRAILLCHEADTGCSKVSTFKSLRILPRQIWTLRLSLPTIERATNVNSWVDKLGSIPPVKVGKEANSRAILTIMMPK